MRTLTVALERKDWELAALCLLLGVTRAAAALPPDAIEAMVEVLSAEPASGGKRRHGPEKDASRGRGR
jgi:hypothetical protein